MKNLFFNYMYALWASYYRKMHKAVIFLGNYGHYVPSAANANPCPAPPPAYSQVESIEKILLVE
jgi:hypothetical protein